MRMTRNANTKRIGGFTLVELLTVVAIIGLLVGMVVPTIRAIIEATNKAKLTARVQTLSAGCGTYKMSATGNKYYPGQDPTHLQWLDNGAYSGAGSALLARCLFWRFDGNDPYNLNLGQFPVEAYAPYNPDMLGEVEGVGSTLIDFDSEPMAILYYPSRIGMKGDVNQYFPKDNQKYTKTANVAVNESTNTPYDIRTYAQGASGGGSSYSKPKVTNDGTYIITAAGSNRLYFGQGAVLNTAN